MGNHRSLHYSRAHISTSSSMMILSFWKKQKGKQKIIANQHPSNPTSSLHTKCSQSLSIPYNHSSLQRSSAALQLNCQRKHPADMLWLCLRYAKHQPLHPIISLTDTTFSVDKQAIATILATIYIITTSFIAKSLFKLWSAVVCNVITLILWVITIAVLVDENRPGCGGHRNHGCYRKRYEKGVDGIWAATLALCALEG